MRRLFVTTVALSILALAATTLTAGASAPTTKNKAALGAFVLPPWLEVDGKSLAEWQRAAFRWTSGIPTDGPRPHPMLAEGEVDCSYAQRGRVWFLESGRNRPRSCSIPFGKILYVPVNFWFCIPEADGVGFPECEAQGEPFLDEAVATLTLDGRRIDVTAWRTETGQFTAKLARENIWELFFGVELGRTTELSSDGEGVLVLLGPGRHTVVASVTFDFDDDGIPDTVETSSHEIRVRLR